MNTEEEWKMARYNMGFLYPNGLEKLRKTVRIASTADQLEPNNSIATASIIEDQQLDLTLHNPFDEDFIKYIVPSTSEKSIKITITHDFPIDD
ncbi:hypothetical protein [Aquimarina celericrescens]|uniref:Uncharacterized protein n=1 Tax=Aquimarina celericrescens TaxID=1964542 RepID=A0ABW5AQG7_9FLAO|nr:hypothetical protein [Aquimarina celericrescens]